MSAGPMLWDVAMPVDLPDDIAQRLRAAASARGVPPEQVVIEAVEARLLADEKMPSENPLATIAAELRQMAFDGSLRAEIDEAIEDPELAVG